MIKGRITISNPSDGLVSIRMKDEVSGARFIEIRMTHEDFMQGIMGLAERPIDMEVEHLEKVGKQKHTKELIIKLPKGNQDRKESAKELISLAAIKESQRTGKLWIADMYLNSQNSFFYKDGIEYARTTMSYWGEL